MAKAQSKSADAERKKRAKERYLRLVYTAPTEKVVQKKKDDGSWGDAHALQTSGSDATDCSCPDSRIRGMKCYHQHAWEDWTFEEVILHDGERVEL